MPLKLPVLAEDMALITEIDKIPLDVIVRGLEAQYSIEKSEYWGSYLVYFYYEKFKQLLNDKKYEKAREILEKAKKILYDYRYHFYYGLLFAKLEDYENAEIELKRSISMNPNFYIGYYELGNVLYLKKEFDDAIEMYLKAFELNKEFFLPLLKIGDAYFENGQLKDAETTYKAALKIEKNPQIYLRLGVLYNYMQKYEKAEKMFKEGLSVEYKPELAYNLSFTLTKLGKHFQALQILKELVNNAPAPEVYNELGLLQKNLGIYDEAKENLKLAGEEYEENYLKTLLFTDGYSKEIFEKLRKYDPDYVEFLKNVYEKEKEKLEEHLSNIEFPFSYELNQIFELTDENGEVLLDRLNELEISDFKEKLKYIFASAYIAGADPILIEKNLVKTAMLLFKSDNVVAFYKVFQIIYFGRLFEKLPFENIIEKSLEVLSEFDFNLLKKAQKVLEYEKTSLEDFWENYEEKEDLDAFVLKFLELISYEPTIHELNNDTLIGQVMKFILKL